ncbi:MAG: hypothetical protein KDD56_02460 [Bdellovibrionales bacterium]|nr:hypothetical protein [Bdellovibrionales bacterium]
MVSYLVLTTTTDEALAQTIINKLESNSIEAILEHVEISDGNLQAAGYRILAPAQKVQTALNIVEKIQENYFHSEYEEMLIFNDESTKDQAA